MDPLEIFDTTPSARARKRMPGGTIQRPGAGGAAPDLLTTHEMLVRFPWFSRNFWARKRMQGEGPAYLKVGGAIFYRERDVLAWMDAQRVVNTAAHKGRSAAA